MTVGATVTGGREGELLWTPSAERVKASNLTAFMRWLGSERGLRFGDYPGVWRQGDFFRINRRGGCFVLGRSDATLNRHGVRIDYQLG